MHLLLLNQPRNILIYQDYQYVEDFFSLLFSKFRHYQIVINLNIKKLLQIFYFQIFKEQTRCQDVKIRSQKSACESNNVIKRYEMI